MNKISLGFIALSSFVLFGFWGCFDERIGQRVGTFQGGANRLFDYVDTRMATGGIPWVAGMNSPAAFVPHGLVKLGPDTQFLGKIQSSSGYYYPDSEIIGFSHNRYEGTGAWEGGILRVIPSNTAKDFSTIAGHSLVFRHREEIAQPAYYRNLIENLSIEVELSATAHAGLHRYRFRKTGAPHLIIDLSSHLSPKGRVESINAQIVSNQKISGSLILKDDFSGRVGGTPYFFTIQSSVPFVASRFFSKDSQTSANSISNAQGKNYLDLTFSQAANSPIELYVGLSLTSEAASQSNLNIEVITPSKSFETVVTDSQALWQDKLSKIQISTADEKQMRLFYTNLYRSFAMPTVVSDTRVAGSSDNEYLGFDQVVRTANNFYFYGELSLWDTFRTVHPLYNLIAQSTQLDVIKSMLLMADQGGRLPRWATANGHADAMMGLPGIIAISESYQKGITNFDAAGALAFMVKAATNQNTVKPMCLAEYIQHGFCTADTEESVSATLEFSYADHSLSLFARALGDTGKANEYATRSKNYKNLWYLENKAFVPRYTTGLFMTPFQLLDLSYLSVIPATKHFTEGSPDQWRWYVPWDVSGLSELFSGQMVDELKNFFSSSSPQLGMWYPSAHYWHGNEPDIHAPFLFNELGHPELTQYWVRWVLDHKYALTSIGIDGNDDGGTLSAWYVFAALGFYPVAGTTRYWLSAPLYERADIQLASGTLKIRTLNFSSANKYISAVRFNGALLPQPYFDHSLIQNGGEILFEMASRPSAWSTQ